MEPLNDSLATENASARAATSRATRSLEAAAEHNDLAGLQKAAQQFEALFLNEMLKSMRSTVPENDLWGQSGGSRIYQQMHDQALADGLATRGEFGIGDLIVRQFRDRIVPSGEDGAAALPARGLPHRSVAAYQAQAACPSPTIAAGSDRMRVLHERAGVVGGAAADSLASFGTELARASRETGVDPGLLLAVTVQESGGNPGAVSSRGARGLMQLMPATAREVGVGDPHDPAQGLLGGARYLARMLDRYDGRLDLALAAYNAGPGAVDRAGVQVPDYGETRRYVARVSDLAVRLGLTPGMELAK